MTVSKHRINCSRCVKRCIFEYRVLTAERKENIMIDKAKVEEALKEVRPTLQRDGGDIELVSVEDNGVVKVRLKGACGSCPMSTMTLKMGVEKHLKQQIPEVTEVVQVA